MIGKFLYMVKSDRQAVIGLMIVLLVAVALMYALRDKDKESASETSSSIDSQQRKNSRKHSHYYAQPAKPIHLTVFDPNTADSTQLLALGLQPWQVRNIYRYRAAGGVYTCPEDFARLYGLTAKKYRELLPYIRISPDYRPASEVYGRRQRTTDGYQSSSCTTNALSSATTTATTEKSTSPYPQKLKAGQTISLNTSDTLLLIRVPGIGPYFARRIARYRERLGGYTSTQQLLEIQDFPESALPYFSQPTSADLTSLRKLNINKATPEQLRNHPYISYLMARHIIDYRRLHGTITDLNDFRLLPLFTPEVIAKLRPYITY